MTSSSVASSVPLGGPAVARPAGAGRFWLFGPWLDLVFVANLLWPAPLVALLVAGVLPSRMISYWLIYFLTTPHRWITLVLVFFDRERFAQDSRSFVAIGAASVLACGGAFALFGLPGLYVLLAIDFVWNAWHFASQHAGILRIYGRLGHGEQAGSGRLEKLLLRVFVLFALLRLASLTLPQEARFGPHLEWLRAAGAQLAQLDLPLLLLPAVVLGRDLWRLRPLGRSRLVYLLSITALYGLLIGSVHQYERTGAELYAAAVLALAGSAAIFHATEYLAIVTWAATRKRNPQGVLAYLVPRWALTLAVLIGVLALGAATVGAWYGSLWLLLNVAVAFLHYTYDGMIWKSSRTRAVRAQ